MTEHKIITRAEAKARGLKRYFTGKPCKHGHVAERKVAGWNCVKCHNERQRERKREKRANDPEWVARQREWTREWQRKKYATDPEWAERERERNRERVREKMAAGLCVKCGKEPAVTKRYCWTCADNHNARHYML